MRPVKDSKAKDNIENTDSINDEGLPVEYNFYNFFVLLEKTSDNTLSAYMRKAITGMKSNFEKAYEGSLRFNIIFEILCYHNHYDFMIIIKFIIKRYIYITNRVQERERQEDISGDSGKLCGGD